MSKIISYLLKRLIRLKFPSVQPLTTIELAQWLENAAIPDLLILDARSEAEYVVSHLPAAKHLKATNFDAIASGSAPSAIAPETKIVVYCSIGYRSAKAAQQFQQAGFLNVFNLEGGIFQWANEQRPIFNDGLSTQRVHPYNNAWGKLLKADHRHQAE